MNKTPNKSAKTTLSRLLASENIYVIHDGAAKTASFDIKNRTLTLPVLLDMSDEMYDMFIGHEVAHALFTPFTEADQKCLDEHKCLSAAYEVASGDSNFFTLAHSYMNIVEDARIERLIKDKFPGLRRDFYIGYGELYRKNFFDTDGMDIDSYSLIDRINLYFKIGTHINIKFTDEEMEFVEMVDKTRSFEDVVDVTKKIWNYVKNKHGDNMIDVHSDSNSSDVIIVDSDNSDSNSIFAKENKKKNNDRWTSRSCLPPDCITQQNFDKKFARAFVDKDNTQSHNYYTIPTFNMKTGIVTYNEVMQMFDELAKIYPDYNRFQTDADKFIVDSNKVVNIMAQVFLAKKAAKEHRRNCVNRTGVIDTVRMMNYKFTDDIFRRMNVVYKGKSHGLVFFVDLSGSMSPVIEDTFKQMIQMVLFCKRVNIPFEVYGFTTKHRGGLEMDKPYAIDNQNPCENYDKFYNTCWIENTSGYSSINNEDLYKNQVVNAFTLINLFSSKMTKREIAVSVRNILATSTYYKRTQFHYAIPTIMELSSTPLIETIAAAMDIVPAFKAANNLDIVHSIFLTDGEPSGINMRCRNSHAAKNNFVYDFDPKNGIHEDMIMMFREYTGSKAIQFFICDQKTNLPAFLYHGTSSYKQSETTEDFDKAEKSYVKEGWAVARNDGTMYNDKFIIRANSSVYSNDGLDGILSERTSNVGIRNAFVKAMSASIVSRVMLNRFIDLIATE